MLGDRRLTMLIVAAACGVRLITFFVVAPQPFYDDARDYVEMSDALLSGRPFPPDWPPGLAVLLALSHQLAGSDPVVPRATMLLVWVGLAWIVYKLAMELFHDRRVANLALIGVGFAPVNVLTSVTPLTQIPTAACLCAAALLTVRSLHGRGVFTLCALGSALGTLVLLRPSSLAVAVLVPVWLLWQTRRVSSWLVPTALAGLIVGAWVVHISALSGRFVFINDANSQNFYYGNNDWTPLYKTWWFGSHKAGEPGVPAAFVAQHRSIISTPAANRDRLFTAYAIRHITSHPWLFAARTMSRVRTFLAPDSYTGSFLMNRVGASRAVVFGALALDALVFAVVALAACACFFAIRPLRAEIFTLAGIAALYALPYAVTFSHPTYHFPVVPLITPLAAAYLAWRPPLRSRRMFAITTVALVAVQIEYFVMVR